MQEVAKKEQNTRRKRSQGSGRWTRREGEAKEGGKQGRKATGPKMKSDKGKERTKNEREKTKEKGKTPDSQGSVSNATTSCERKYCVID